tara:strand:+ start:795 stop:1568 length:774 start_codon:yes stop_codon:yes gene_type:complete
MDIKVPFAASEKQKAIYRRDANAVINILLNKLKYPPNAVAGIMANIAIETGYTYDFKKKQDKGGPGRGLFQMEVGRMFDAYQRWMKANNKQDSALSQLEYMDAAIKGTDGSHPTDKGRAFLGTKIPLHLNKSLHDELNTVDKMTMDFRDKFENPKSRNSDKERLMQGQNFLKTLKSRQTFEGDLGRTHIDYKYKQKKIKDNVNNNYSKAHIKDITSADIVSTGIDTFTSQSFSKKQISDSFADNEYYQNFFEKESIS